MQFQKTKKKDIDEVRFCLQKSVKARTKKYFFIKTSECNTTVSSLTKKKIHFVKFSID
jgi:hypothetical protein